MIRRRDTGGFEHRRRDVHEADEVVDLPAGVDLLRPTDQERHHRPEVVQVALAPRHAGHAVVAGNDDQGVVEFTARLQFLDQFVHHPIPGEGLTQVVGDVLTNIGHVRQEGGDLSLQRIRVQAPEFLARSPRPLAMRVVRPEPVEERLVLRVVVKEGPEIGTDEGEDLPLSRFLVLGRRDRLGEVVDRQLVGPVHPLRRLGGGLSPMHHVIAATDEQLRKTGQAFVRVVRLAVFLVVQKGVAATAVERHPGRNGRLGRACSWGH